MENDAFNVFQSNDNHPDDMLTAAGDIISAALIEAFAQYGANCLHSQKWIDELYRNANTMH